MRSGGFTKAAEILLREARRLQGETTALRVRQKGEILFDIKDGEIAEQPGQRFGRLPDENDAGVDGETVLVGLADEAQIVTVIALAAGETVVRDAAAVEGKIDAADTFLPEKEHERVKLRIVPEGKAVELQHVQRRRILAQEAQIRTEIGKIVAAADIEHAVQLRAVFAEPVKEGRGEAHAADGIGAVNAAAGAQQAVAAVCLARDAEAFDGDGGGLHGGFS